MTDKMDHIGIAVHSIEEARTFYEGSLGLKVDDVVEIPERKVRLGIIRMENQVIELVEPLGENSTVQKFLDKKGEGIHHIAFKVEDIEAELEILRQKGVELITPQSYRGAHGRKVAFLSPKSCHGVLIELCQD